MEEGDRAHEDAEAIAARLVRSSPQLRTSGTVALIGAGLIVGPGLLAFVTGVPLAVAFYLSPVGVLLVVAGLAARRALPVDALRMGALDEIQRGRLEMASRLLDILEARAGAGRVRLSALAMRGQIALLRGDVKGARVSLGRALEARVPWLGGFRAEHVGCRALCALAAALDGDDAAARIDARAARESVAAGEFGWGNVITEGFVRVTLARAALAEAVVLWRAGDRSALAAHLAEHRFVLVEGTQPRERALYRGLVSFADTRGSSAYRNAPARDGAGALRTPEAWVERIAPEIGALLDREPRGRLPSRGAASAAAPGPLTRTPVRPSAPSSKIKGPWVLLLWILAATVFFALWELFDTTGAPRAVEELPSTPPAPTLIDHPAVWPIVMGSVVVGITAWLLRIGNAKARATSAFMARLAVDPSVAAPTRSDKTVDLFVETARSCALSRAAFAEGRLEAALDHADAAFVSAARIKHLDGEQQGMMSEARGLAVAALGRAPDARGEMATWPATYSRRGVGAFAIELLIAVREGDLDAATDLAASAHADLSLDVRSEALVDLLRARQKALGEVAKERLARDLQGPALRSFVTAVAPALLADFERNAVIVKDDTDAELDVDAGDEADADARPRARGGRTA